MLDILEELMDINGYKYERIDGSVTGQVIKTLVSTECTVA